MTKRFGNRDDGNCMNDKNDTIHNDFQIKRRRFMKPNKNFDFSFPFAFDIRSSF
jgi:hypothetical protein